MASAEIALVVGWTGPIDLILQSAGSAADLDGCTAELVVQGLGMSGSTTIVSASAGTVRYAPEPGDFASAGRYSARVKVTQSSGKVVFFPNRDAIQLVVGN
jgi:hypothetical protein